MHVALSSKQTETDPKYTAVTQKSRRAKQPLQYSLASTYFLSTSPVGNQPPPWLRLSTGPQASDEQPVQFQEEWRASVEDHPPQRTPSPSLQFSGNQVPPGLRLSTLQQAGQGQAVPLEDIRLRNRKENTTGLPDPLKAGVEQLSGLSLDDVQVHYNSAKPAEVQALAYTQGTDIHVGPGQEQHVAHEAWHVVQQKQGRVKPTLQAKGVAINDDQGLEREADVMGEQTEKASTCLWHRNSTDLNLGASGPIQRQIGAPVIQMTAAADLPAAEQNRGYLVNETGQLSNAGQSVYAAINGAAAGKVQDDAAAGLRYYWQTLIDGFDGKKAEMYEAELLVTNGEIPILSTDDRTDPDVRVNTAQGVEATEVKTINSDQTSNVNTLIKGADKQLGKRDADVRKIKIRIESRNNFWPGIVENRKLTDNADLRKLISTPNYIPHLEDTDEIQIEGINVPYNANTRNFFAKVKTNGDVNKNSAQVWP